MAPRASRSSRRTAFAAGIAILIGLAGARGGAADPPERLFELPEAGSYRLPVIDRVSPHELLDSSGQRTSLLGIDRGECAVVSFVYASCPDAGGCPLVLATLRRVDRAVAQRGDLSKRVRLVTVSFDPQRDTPEKLATLRLHLDPAGDWRFLTASSDDEIRPVLDDYGQDALRLVSAEDGRSLPLIRHVAKVFLVDSSRRVRNVYSTGFLDPALLVRDIETVLLAGDANDDPR